MSLGPYPRGDAAGMRTLARRIRFKAAIVRNSPEMMISDFNALPVKAPFLGLAAFRLQVARATGLATAGQLDSVASLLDTKADDVEQNQRAWNTLRDRLAAEARAAAAKAKEGS